MEVIAVFGLFLSQLNFGKQLFRKQRKR